jgi:hypothetical protein
MQSRLLASLLIVNLVSLFVLMKLLPTPEATVLPKWEYTIESVADLEFETGMLQATKTQIVSRCLQWPPTVQWEDPYETLPLLR